MLHKLKIKPLEGEKKTNKLKLVVSVEIDSLTQQILSQHSCLVVQVTSSRVPINQVPSNRAGNGGVTELRDPRLAPGYTSPRTKKQREREEYKRLWQQQHPEVSEYIFNSLFVSGLSN